MKAGQCLVDLCEESVIKDSLTTQLGSEGKTHGDAPADHFPDVRKMICYMTCSKLLMPNQRGNCQGMLDRSRRKAWTERGWGAQP